jgi:hypothetical protein
MICLIRKQFNFYRNSQNTGTDISMHNSSWAALCSGQMGIPLQWHAHGEWNEVDKIDIEEFYSNFNGLASFVNGLDFETHKYRPSVKTENELIYDKGNSQPQGNTIEMDVEIFVMQNDNSGINEKSDRGFGWVHHKKGNWKVNTNGLNNKTCQESLLSVEDLPQLLLAATYQYNLNGFKSGDYLIEAYDTQNGNLIFSSSANNAIHSDLFNVLKLGVPLVNLFHDPLNPRYDYAFKFWHSSVNGNDLRLTNNNNSDSTKIKLLLPGDNDEFKKHLIVSVAPNPTIEDLEITSAGNGFSEIWLTDATGQMIHHESFSERKTHHQKMDNFSNGLYFLSVKSHEGIVKIFKIVKQ